MFCNKCKSMMILKYIDDDLMRWCHRCNTQHQVQEGEILISTKQSATQINSAKDNLASRAVVYENNKVVEYEFTPDTGLNNKFHSN